MYITLTGIIKKLNKFTTIEDMASVIAHTKYTDCLKKQVKLKPL
jgi:hypothetical protein